MPESESATVIHTAENAVRLDIRTKAITVTLHDPQTGPRDVTVLEVVIVYQTVPGSNGPGWQPCQITYVLDDRDHPWAFASDEALQDSGQWPAGVEELVDAYRPEESSADG